jgi:DedD protein
MGPQRTKTEKNPKKYWLQLTATALFFWSLGLTFLLSWVFVLGIFVGRGDISIGIVKDQLSGTHDGVEAVATPQNSEPSPVEPLTPDPKLDFYEELAPKKEPAPQGDMQTKPEKPQLPIKKPIPTEPTAPRLEDKPTENKAVPPRTENKDSGYVLQIGSFQDKASAAELVSRLNARGYSTFISTTQVRGKQYYRVKCGPFKTENEADQAKRTLAGRERVNGFVTRAEN